MDRAPDGQVNAAQAPAGAAKAAPAPPTLAQAKARLIAAAEACDPSRAIAEHPWTTVTAAAALGLIAGNSRTLPQTLLSTLDAVLQITAAASRNLGGDKPAEPENPSAKPEA